MQEEKAKLSDLKALKGQILPKFDATNFAAELLKKKKMDFVKYENLLKSVFYFMLVSWYLDRQLPPSTHIELRGNSFLTDTIFCSVITLICLNLPRCRHQIQCQWSNMELH